MCRNRRNRHLDHYSWYFLCPKLWLHFSYNWAKGLQRKSCTFFSWILLYFSWSYYGLRNGQMVIFLICCLDVGIISNGFYCSSYQYTMKFLIIFVIIIDVLLQSNTCSGMEELQFFVKFCRRSIMQHWQTFTFLIDLSIDTCVKNIEETSVQC